MKFRTSPASIRIVWAVAFCLLGAAVRPGLRAEDWPQWMGPERDGVWRETEVLWCHPAFAQRRAYVHNGRELICLDLSVSG